MNIRGFLNRLMGRAIEVRSYAWDVAGSGNRLANWNAQPTAVNAWVDNPVMVRARSEGEFRNNAWAKKITDATLAAVIGAAGLVPQFKDKAIADAWGAWADNCDAAGRLDWVQFLWLVLQTVIVSGECFIRFGVNPDAAVPLTLQVLGPEFLDTSRVDANTYAGIQYDGLRRAGYWLYERHPTLAPLHSVFVPHTECLHVFRPITPGAERGVPWLADVLLALRELAEYQEAETVRAKVASLYCGYVQTADGSNPLHTTNAVPTLEPGSMVRLQPGEIVEFSRPPEAGKTYDPFVRSVLRKIASGAGVPYEVLANDISSCTFASGRMVLLEWARSIDAIQHAFIVPQVCAPIMARWMRQAVSLSVIPAAQPARWIGPRISMLDEKSETAAVIAKIRAGLMSRSEAVSEMGWVAEDIDREIAADNARADELGLVLDSDPRKTTLQGQANDTAATE
ncbi:MAG TPA: phage portal protein [Bryobacteraceae bacterium]|nr:phage portal protein [Bryobacteraceae bacterium]